MFDVDKLVKSPKFRHACEGRHPEVFENTGFPPLPSLGQALRGNDAKGRFKTFYETINVGLSMYDVHLLKNHPKGYRNTETFND